MSLLFTAISTTMHRFRRPAWLCRKMASELRGLSLTRRWAGADAR
uniref:Uncharacterized protein n=1 Tax=Arundo donax TaxID=35708 RepID=A0A0A9EPW8_ARUDO